MLALSLENVQTQTQKISKSAGFNESSKNVKPAVYTKGESKFASMVDDFSSRDKAVLESKKSDSSVEPKQVKHASKKESNQIDDNEVPVDQDERPELSEKKSIQDADNAFIQTLLPDYITETSMQIAGPEVNMSIEVSFEPSSESVESKFFNDLSVSSKEIDFLSMQVSDVEAETFIAEASAAFNDMVNLEGRDAVEALQNLSLENPKEFLEVADIASSITKAGKDISLEIENNSSITDNQKLWVDKFLAKDETFVQPEPKQSLFTVIDQRTQLQEEVQFNSSEEIKADVKIESDSSLDVTYSLNNLSQQNILASNDQSASASGSAFQQMVTQQISSNVNDFVKAGTILLKDNNTGTINLNLKPEALGNVKITLQVSDKVITGQIVVASKEAFEAFKENLEQFKQAFQQNGFENATLNLTFAENNSSGFMNQEQQGRQMTDQQFQSNKAYGDYSVASAVVDESVSGFEYTDGTSYQIDVVA